MSVVGVLHPGSMGAAVAAQALRNSSKVLWCPTNRSAATIERAGQAKLTAVSTVADVTSNADVILSICPPEFATEVAESVAAQGFSGVYVDANAVSPATAAEIQGVVCKAGARFVDGSIIGSPPSDRKRTRLYLAGLGDDVESTAELFDGTSVKVGRVSEEIGRASALKLAYSSYQKASRVLAAVSHGLASSWGVQEELQELAEERSASYLAEVEYVPKVAARAWRWAPEMREAAVALDQAGLPDHMAEAAALVMERWSDAKDQDLTIAEALEGLRAPGEDGAP